MSFSLHIHHPKRNVVLPYRLCPGRAAGSLRSVLRNIDLLLAMDAELLRRFSALKGTPPSPSTTPVPSGPVVAPEERDELDDEASRLPPRPVLLLAAT
jgi:hypothetical protein